MVNYYILTPLKNPNSLAVTIYNNFRYLTDPTLNHTIEEIKRLLTSSNFVGIALSDNGNVVGYLVGEYKKLNDGRFVYYITYIYVSKKYRGKKLSTLMLNKIHQIVKQKNIQYIILTCANNLVDYYEKHGYKTDLLIPSYMNNNVNVMCLNV